MYTVVSLGGLPRGTAAQIISRLAQQEQDEATTDTRSSFPPTISLRFSLQQQHECTPSKN